VGAFGKGDSGGTQQPRLAQPKPKSATKEAARAPASSVAGRERGGCGNDARPGRALVT